MDFTLDSVTQALEALKNINKGKAISKTAVLISDLKNMNKKSSTFYFGVLTVGSTVVKAVLKNENDNEIITILQNSQIVELFSEVTFLDASDVQIASPKGQFRGFEITIR